MYVNLNPFKNLKTNKHWLAYINACYFGVRTNTKNWNNEFKQLTGALFFVYFIPLSNVRKRSSFGAGSSYILVPYVKPPYVDRLPKVAEN